MNERFLNSLLGSISVSDYEEPVQDVVEAEMKDYVDEIRRVEMQNLTCVLNPESDVRSMLSAHADEKDVEGCIELIAQFLVKCV